MDFSFKFDGLTGYVCDRSQKWQCLVFAPRFQRRLPGPLRGGVYFRHLRFWVPLTVCPYTLMAKLQPKRVENEATVHENA